MGVGRLKKTKLLVDQLEDRRLMAVIDPDIVPHDGTDTSFVRNLYEDVLNRPADAGGEASFRLARLREFRHSTPRLNPLRSRHF